MKRLLSIGLAAMGLAGTLLLGRAARAEAPCEQDLLLDFAPADGATGVPTDVVLRFIHNLNGCGEPGSDFSSPSLTLDHDGTPVELQLEPFRANDLYEQSIPGGLSPNTEYSLHISSFDVVFLETKFTTGDKGSTVSGPPKLDLGPLKLDPQINLGQGVFNFFDLTFTPAQASPDYVSVFHLTQLDEDGGNPDEFLLIPARPGAPFTLGLNAKIKIGEKLCFRAVQEDAAGHLSDPSDIVCGDTIGPELPEEPPVKADTTAKSSCSAAPWRASSSGLAVAGLLALAALARRRSRR